MRTLALASLVLLVSCRANIPGGRFRCTSDSDCPPGLRCVVNLCEHPPDTGIVPPPDGGGTDAPMTTLENTMAACVDGQDNDSDGFTDCNDAGCCSIASCSANPVCSCTTTTAVNVLIRQPTIVFLLDRSSSFTAAWSGLNKWDAMRQVVANPGSVMEQFQARVRFGLITHDNDTTLPPECVFAVAEVPAAISNLPAISTALSALAVPPATNGSFLLGAIEDVVNRSTTLFGASPTPPAALVLLTDSVPVDCTSGANSTTRAATSLSALRTSQGITTYVVALEPPSTPADHNQLASAGGTSTYRRTLDATALSTALYDIVTSQFSCTFALERSIDPARACEGTVQLDGTVVACGDANGWNAPGASTIQLVGTACTNYLDSRTGAVSATFPCDVVL